MKYHLPGADLTEPPCPLCGQGPLVCADADLNILACPSGHRVTMELAFRAVPCDDLRPDVVAESSS
jgi:hypothetical protein